MEELVDDVEAPGRSPLIRSSSEIERFENLHTVLRLIDRLPPRQRQVLAWTYDGAEDTEIATALRITVQAVRELDRVPGQDVVAAPAWQSDTTFSKAR